VFDDILRFTGGKKIMAVFSGDKKNYQALPQ